MTVALVLGASGCAVTKSSSRIQIPVDASPVSPEIEKRADLVYQVLAGEIAGKLGDLKQATQHYLEAAKLSDDPQISARTAKIALYSQDYDLALRAVERWIALQPENVDALRMAGVLYVQKGEPEKAADYLAKVIDAAGEKGYETSFAHLNLLFGGEAVSADALKTMDLLRQRYPNVIYAQEAYAEMAYRAHDYEAALQGAEAALKLDPSDRKAQIVRYRSMLALGDVDSALAGMKRLVKAHADDVELRHNYARMLVQAKRYEEALAEYERMIAKRPDDMDLVYSAALLEIELDRLEKAKKRLLQLTESPNHRNEAFYYLGVIEEQQGNTKEAIGWLSRIHDGDYYLEAYARIAAMMAKNGQIEDARNYLHRLQEQADSDDVKLQLYLLEGELVRDFEGPQQAYDFYSQLLKRDPDRGELLYARAMVAEKIDHIDWLERDLKKMLEQEPENATVLNALGYTLADRTDRYQEAYDYIEKALKLRPDDPAIIDSMGWVKYRMGDFETAERYLEKAYRITPDAEIAAHLVEVYWKHGKLDQAKQLLTAALKQSPNDKKLLQLKESMQ